MLCYTFLNSGLYLIYDTFPFLQIFLQLQNCRAIFLQTGYNKTEPLDFCSLHKQPPSEKLFLLSWFLNVDEASRQVTLLADDNKAQWCFVLTKPCTLCSIRFLPVCLYDSPFQIRWVRGGFVWEWGHSLDLIFPCFVRRGVVSPLHIFLIRKEELGHEQETPFITFI